MRPVVEIKAALRDIVERVSPTPLLHHLAEGILAEPSETPANAHVVVDLERVIPDLRMTKTALQQVASELRDRMIQVVAVKFAAVKYVVPRNA